MRTRGAEEARGAHPSEHVGLFLRKRSVGVEGAESGLDDKDALGVVDREVPLCRTDRRRVRKISLPTGTPTCDASSPHCPPLFLPHASPLHSPHPVKETRTAPSRRARPVPAGNLGAPRGEEGNARRDGRIVEEEAARTGLRLVRGIIPLFTVKHFTVRVLFSCGLFHVGSSDDLFSTSDD